VFWNLLSNAVKFSPPGGSVQASAAREGNSVVVKVVDTGQGSGAEFLPHAFESFRQEDATRTRRQGGLGLGLAIVRHITEAQGGAVDARSEGSGKGAVFTVTLPLCTEPRLETFGGGDLGRPQLAGLMVLIVRIMSKRLSVVEQKLLKKATARIRERRLAAEKLRMEGFTHAARRGKVVSSFRKKLLNRALDVAGLDGQRIEELQAADARSMDVFAKKQSQGLRQGSGATAKRLGQESRLLDGRYQALATLAPAPQDPVHLHLTTATEIRIATVQMGTPPPAFVTQIAPGRNVVNALLDVSVDHDHFGGQVMFIEWHFIATLPRAGFAKLLALITFNGACGLRIGQSCIKDGRSSALLDARCVMSQLDASGEAIVAEGLPLELFKQSIGGQESYGRSETFPLDQPAILTCGEDFPVDPGLLLVSAAAVLSVEAAGGTTTMDFQSASFEINTAFAHVTLV